MNAHRRPVVWAALAAVLVAGGCTWVDTYETVTVDTEGGTLRAVDGRIEIVVPSGGATDGTRVLFAASDSPLEQLPDQFVAAGDPIAVATGRGAVTRGRVSVAYRPGGVPPEMLTVLAYDRSLPGWIPLAGTKVDTAAGRVSADSRAFDGFVAGTWKITNGRTGPAVQAGGRAVPVPAGTEATFWGYAAGAARTLTATAVRNLAGQTSRLRCTDESYELTVKVTAGPLDGCVEGGVAYMTVSRLRNKAALPLLLTLPAHPDLTPSEGAVSGRTADPATDLRNIALSYLDGTTAVPGGGVVPMVAGIRSPWPVKFTGRPGWPVFALDTGLNLLSLLIPQSRLRDPSELNRLWAERAEHDRSAATALAQGRLDDPAVQRLAVEESLRALSDVFALTACVSGQKLTGADLPGRTAAAAERCATEVIGRHYGTAAETTAVIAATRTLPEAIRTVLARRPGADIGAVTVYAGAPLSDHLRSVSDACNAHGPAAMPVDGDLGAATDEEAVEAYRAAAGRSVVTLRHIRELPGPADEAAEELAAVFAYHQKRAEQLQAALKGQDRKAADKVIRDLAEDPERARFNSILDRHDLGLCH